MTDNKEDKFFYFPMISMPCTGAADIQLSAKEVEHIDSALDAMRMSDVFSGSLVKSREE